MISCESTLILNSVSDKFLWEGNFCHLPHEDVFCMNINVYIILKRTKRNTCWSWILENSIMTQAMKWKIKDSKASGSVTKCVCGSLQGIQEMSLTRLHHVSQFDPGGGNHKTWWYISSGHWLMPPDRLRLHECVFDIFLCTSVFVYVYVCLTFIRIIAGKLHSWGQNLHGFVCLFKQIK